ncbi:glycosyltransferase [Pedobacter sp.]|uniref:glycosyltransferase n=1 Tax=Pedobacter sp. TaxID=1411316 RepID=UPI00356A2925
MAESKAIQSLNDGLESNVNLMVFDNSPSRQYELNNFQYHHFNVNYYHDCSNPGLSTAYNLALNFATETHCKWLMLLDQDTTFTKEYLDEIKTIEKLPDSIVAVIPKVVSLIDAQVISPAIIYLGGLLRPKNLDSGIIKYKITGINSGTILSVAFMNTISGFDKQYTLDMLDHWYFGKIYANKKEVFLMNNTIYQDLSVLGNFEDKVPFNRYKKMIEAEYLLNKEEGLLNLALFKLRLCFRALKQLGFTNKAYYKSTIKHILRVR